MFCQIKLPTRGITHAIDISKIDIIEVGKDPDLESSEPLFILLYKSDSDAPAVKINCAKLKYDELMDLYDWLCSCKRGDEAVTVYNIDCLKNK